MMDIKKQVEYWIKGAENDLDVAELLIRENRILQVLFFCHLVIEKGLKAVIVKDLGEVAPRSHNLVYLSEKAELQFNSEDEIFLGILMKYQLQGRYPDYNPIVPDKFIANSYFENTKILLQWIKEKL